MRQGKDHRIQGASIALALALALSAPAAAEAEPRLEASRFAEPRVISAEPIFSSRCRTPERAGEPCVAVQLAVVHTCQDGKVCYDSKQYLVDRYIMRRLREDFGEYAWIAMRHAEAAVVELGLPGEEDDERERDALRGARRQLRRHRHYTLLPGVNMTLEVEKQIGRLAAGYYRQKRRQLTITSGTRSPDSQAWAMYRKLNQGARYRQLYRQKCAAQEIRQAYRDGRRKRLKGREIVAAMKRVIEAQMKRGVYVSAHLRQGAVDIRSRNMSRSMKWALEGAAREIEQIKLNREERRPPHFHLEVLSGPAESKTPSPPPDPSICPPPAR